ncbi:hypothetical protein QYE76_000253 [Lolium multiflorum]|uniref:Secreted protein n=1 Tax=Lolium multiflorum TaxID=4521 RepID=A0AAD8VY69_LOLMU|nr:hypothetical protein QYE76_000253 [Lolium multiflorum]
MACLRCAVATSLAWLTRVSASLASLVLGTRMTTDGIERVASRTTGPIHLCSFSLRRSHTAHNLELLTISNQHQVVGHQNPCKIRGCDQLHFISCHQLVDRHQPGSGDNRKVGA